MSTSVDIGSPGMPGSTADGSEGPGWRAPAVIAASLVAFVVVAFHEVALLGGTWFDRDALTLVLPSNEFLVSSLRAGRLPQWADWVGLGVPFAANPLHGVLYPPFWLAALLPGPAGRDLVVLVHLVVAAWGAAALSWRLGARGAGAFLAGAVFAGSGYVASMPPNNSVHLLAWTPWVAWGADRVARATATGLRAEVAAALVFAAALAAQLAVGEPAHAVTAGLLAVGFVLARAPRRVRGLAWLGAGAVSAVLLAAAPLLPAARVLGWSSRAGGLPVEAAQEWWMAPARLLELVWPHALGPPDGLWSNLARIVADSRGQGGLVQGPTWAYGLYLGLPVLILAGAAVREPAGRWLLVLAAVLTALAMGPVTPLHELLRAVLPPARMARYPEKHLVGMLVVVSALAGAGFTAAFSPRAPREDGRLTKAAWIATASLGTAVIAALLAREWLTGALVRGAGHVPHPVDVQGGLRFALWSGAAGVAAAAAFAGALWLRARRPAFAALLALAVVAGGAALEASVLTRTIPRSVAVGLPRLLASVPRPGPPALRTRVLTAPLDVRTAFRPGSDLAELPLARPAVDLPAAHGFATLPGGDSLSGASYWRFQQLEGDLFQFGSRLGAEYLLVSLSFALGQGLPVLDGIPPWDGAVMRSLGASPRAYFAPRWRRSGDPLGDWASARRDDGGIVLPAGGDESPPGRESVLPSRCEARSPWPERVELSCLGEVGGYAVLLDSAAPGWTARVDGRPAAIEDANGLFRAVRIPAGPHQVTFEYRTPGLALGVAISLLAWTAWGVALWTLRRRPAPGRGQAGAVSG